MNAQKLYEVIYDDLNEFIDKELAEAITHQLVSNIISNKDKILKGESSNNNTKTKINNVKDKLEETKTNTITIYTDGAATKNGKSGAKSSSGIYIKKLGTMKEIKINKLNETIQFEYNKETKSKKNKNTMVTYNCSNIRGEGYAILYAMVFIRAIIVEKINLLEGDNIKKLEDLDFIYPLDSYTFDYISKIKSSNKIEFNINIKTDSEFWIKTIMTYIPNWIQKNKVFDMKNIDLVCYIYFNYMVLTKNNINVYLIHVRGHPEKRKNKSEYNEDDIGNTIADEVATNGIHNTTYDVSMCYHKE